MRNRNIAEDMSGLVDERDPEAVAIEAEEAEESGSTEPKKVDLTEAQIERVRQGAIQVTKRSAPQAVQVFCTLLGGGKLSFADWWLMMVGQFLQSAQDGNPGAATRVLNTLDRILNAVVFSANIERNRIARQDAAIFRIEEGGTGPRGFEKYDALLPEELRTRRTPEENFNDASTAQRERSETIEGIDEDVLAIHDWFSSRLVQMAYHVWTPSSPKRFIDGTLTAYGRCLEGLPFASISEDEGRTWRNVYDLEEAYNALDAAYARRQNTPTIRKAVDVASFL